MKKKLKLNKETVSELSKTEMQEVEGGFCIASCRRGSARYKGCCGSGRVDFTFSGVSGPCY
ncbi:class I lanthipeptide [Aquimarina algiphila]|uniref:class I lanthipeptide n=1 Tax=Aquimarina algiphila TaxID=2047982 RepID=UPI00248FD37C|nr:class I lanthipeptide [Aquimarina algiphila]